MANKIYDANFKEAILRDMRESGLSVYEAAKKYEVTPNTIYRWLEQTNLVKNKDLIKEIRSLKAENKILLDLIEKLSIRAKKKT